MTTKNEVLRIDPGLRMAMLIGTQAGVDTKITRAWYEAVVMDEMTPGDYFQKIRERVKDPALRGMLDAILERVRFLVLPQEGTPSVR